MAGVVVVAVVVVVVVIVEVEDSSSSRVSIIRQTDTCLWPPYVIGGPLYFCPVISIFYLSSIFFFSFLA